MYKKLCFFECESKLLCVVALLAGAFRLVRLLEAQFFNPIPDAAAANAVSCGYLPGRRIRVFPNCYVF